MIRRILLLLVLLLVLLVAVAFAALNPGIVTVNLGWFDATMQKSLLVTLVFAAGWMLGLLSLGVVLARMLVERRRLRRALRLAEAEVSTLRSVPTAHAD